MTAHSAPETLPALPAGGINYERLYTYRFRDIDQAGRQAVWREIARYAHGRMGAPRRVLDPAAGRGEFITAAPAAERWGIDLVGQGVPESAGVNMIISDIMDAALPGGYFDGVFLSNFLEHLPGQNAIAAVLGKLHAAMAAGRPDRGHRPELPVLRPRVLRLRRPHRDPHPRRGRRAPARRRVRRDRGGTTVPAVLLPRPAAAVTAADQDLPPDTALVAAARQAVPGARP